MLNTLRSVRAQIPFLSYPHQPHFFTRRSVTRIRLVQAVSGPNQPDSSKKMDQKQEIKSQDTYSSAWDEVMSSFGIAYATRSDEEGFGGIYTRDEDDKIILKIAPGHDPSQGSEVKEKEAARNQSKVKSP